MRLNDFEVRGTDMDVNGSFSLDTEDVGGNSSSTDSSFKGIKPKKFDVVVIIPYDNASDLTALMRRAEAVDENGSLVVYQVVDHTMNSMNVREASFSGGFRVMNGGDIQAWTVSFQLTEYFSTAEKAEQRTVAQVAEPPQQQGEAKGVNPFAVKNFVDSDILQLIGYSDEALS